MAADPPERPPTATFLAALDVRRNAVIGIAVGLAFALIAYLVRVLELLGPFQGTRTFPLLGVGGWFLMLAFVLATTTAILVTALLTVVSAARLARSET